MRSKYVGLLLATVSGFLLSGSILRADTITFANQDPVSDPDVKINGDTMRRISWENRDGSIRGNAFPWEVTGYTLQRGSRKREASALEDSWNKVVRAGAREVWNNVEEQYEQALKAEQDVIKENIAGYKDLNHMRLHLLYVRLRAAAERGEDITDALAEYEQANIAYAKEMVKDRSFSTGRLFQSGPYKGVDYGALHSTTFDALIAVAVSHRKNSELQEAFDNGYKLASVLGEDMRRATSKDEYIKTFAIPALEAAATMFENAQEPDWNAAAEIYTNLRSLYSTIEDKVSANRMEMSEARCKVNLGDTSSASRVYTRALKDYEELNEDNAPSSDWLTPERAALYAAAYTGLGQIAMIKGDEFEALRNFVKSLAFFSTDREERANALLQAGYATVALAKRNNEEAEYYYKSGTSYLVELKKTLGDTRAADQAADLAAKLGSIQPSAAQ